MGKSTSAAYERVEQLLGRQECVILDGGVATELQRVGMRDQRLSDKALWGTWALFQSPYSVLEVHRRYAGIGCDVISTNTWAIMSAPEFEAQNTMGRSGISHWMDAARLGIRLARRAIQEAGRSGECAVAFSVNGDIEKPQQQETLHLLTRIFEEDPPDLILMETLTLIRDNLTYPAIERMLRTGLPVWLSFRRCLHGVCGVFGQHWGGPEGDLFGRATQRFESLGVRAVLLNCLPADHVPGMLTWLRDFTDLPLGVYPNLGRYLDPGWQFDERVGPEEYTALALQWREEGAQLIGGCCGVTPEHIAAAKASLKGTKPGHRRGLSAAFSATHLDPLLAPAHTARAPKPWMDEQNRVISPLPFPDLVCDPGVFLPTQGSYLLWKFIFRGGIGRGQRCLDVGCGTGILTVQLALNGAVQVRAIDIQREAVANTMTNAYRNGIADRVVGSVVDLYTYLPTETYDVVAASLFQMPVDPFKESSGHRPVDYWGRNLLDHFIRLLPDLLNEDGVAYFMQVSMLSQMRTAELLDEAHLDFRVLDFSFYPFSSVFYENMEQIRRVEELSDAYHLNLGADHVMVMYLVEARRRR
ncbi:MAG: homocysteine S-methyltransferase family protein [Candidatus Tectomicrobia bacterium]|nr:homocysteine S-methyltransferase family protein [Candidatus Tectomicrobia bacterium]